MKRILCAILVAVMLLSTFTVFASAAANTTTVTFEKLSDYVASAKAGQTIFVTKNVEVTEGLKIPATVTVVIMPGAILHVEQKLLVEGALVVYGILYPNSQMNITSNRGYLDYAPTTGYWWDSYVDSYRQMINMQGQGYVFCPVCRKAITHCTTCNAPHCATCSNHSTLYYCTIHSQAKKLCDTCKWYYCDKCGTHTHTNLPVVPSLPTYYCTTHNQAQTYCYVCHAYFCNKCIPNHTHTNIPTTPSVPTLNYCTEHKQFKTFCYVCYNYVCDKCTPTHAHTPTTVVPPIVNDNYYSNGYVYVQGIGWVYLNLPNDDIHFGNPIINGNYLYYNNAWLYLNTCAAVEASIKSGSKVEAGTTLTLSTKTPGAKIYYTTDGSNPSVKSALYEGPITLTEDTAVIKAIAVKSIYNSSALATFKYTVTATASFTDIAAYEGLKDSLTALVLAGVIEDGEKFNPEGSFTYGELCEYLEAIGADLDKVKLGFEDDDILTNEDFIYVTYRILKANKIVGTPKISGNAALKTLKYKSEMTNEAIYKAAYTSFIEHDMLYALDFKPADNATRAYLATALAAIIAE